MNPACQFLALVLVVTLGAHSVDAGTISYVAIPATQSDANCGISRDHAYTTAVDGGNTRGTNRLLNGITLYALSGGGQNTAVADNCTLNALSGSLTDAGLTSKSIQADGTVRDLVSDMVFNNAGGDNSQVEIVLDPDSLEAGATYDLRVYICSSSGQNRQVNLAFFGDGGKAAETGFFNEDDARTSAGGFQTASQVYCIDYRYTWDGDSTPGITVTQKFGGAPFCLYALTNELVTEGSAGAAATSNVAASGGQGEEEPGISSGLVNQESDEIGVESDDFYGSESLNAHGRWIELERWGTCWQPTDVPSGWGPYTDGNWKECDDCGWTFVSDEPWAWACYHYGRWCRVRTGCGWAWVPGKVWAASWVSWRQGRDDSCNCIGWAPLPPEAGCRLGVGISSWVDHTCNIGPEYYTFVNIRDFGSDSYSGCGCIYERSRNPAIIIDTFNCTNIFYRRHVNIYCGGPDFNWCNTRIRQLGGKECGRIYVNRYDNPARLGGQFAKHEGNQLSLVSPRIRGERNPKHRPKAAESLDSNEIDHGWTGIKDKKEERELRNRIGQETRGKNPRNSPARLPADVVERLARHRGTQGGAGQGLGGGNLHPGGKGKQGREMGEGAGQGQAATGADQPPGKKRKGRGQGQVAGGGAEGLGQGATFDQHPGKNRAHDQMRNVGTGGGNQQAGGNQMGGGNQETGGGGGRHHPGQSFKKQGATTGGAAGRGDRATGGPAGGPSNGPGIGPAESEQTARAGQEATTGGGAGGGRGHRRSRRLQQGVPQSQVQGQNYGQGAAVGGGSSGQGNRYRQSQTQGGAQGGGGQGQGRYHQQPTQQLQQQQQQFRRQQQGNSQVQGGGRGGGGGGRRRKDSPTPPTSEELLRTAGLMRRELSDWPR
jgi:hypothetical protein